MILEHNILDLNIAGGIPNGDNTLESNKDMIINTNSQPHEFGWRILTVTKFEIV